MTIENQASDLLICPQCGEVHAFTPVGDRIVACLLCGAIIKMLTGGKGELLNMDVQKSQGSGEKK